MKFYKCATVGFMVVLVATMLHGNVERAMIELQLKDAATEVLVYRLNLELAELINGNETRNQEILDTIGALEARAGNLPINSKDGRRSVVFEGQELAKVFIDKETVEKTIALSRWYLRLVEK